MKIHCNVWRISDGSGKNWSFAVENCNRNSHHQFFFCFHLSLRRAGVLKRIKEITSSVRMKKKQLLCFEGEHSTGRLDSSWVALNLNTVLPRKGVLERRKVLTFISGTINTFIAKSTQSLYTHQSSVGQEDRFFKLSTLWKKTFPSALLGWKTAQF